MVNCSCMVCPKPVSITHRSIIIANSIYFRIGQVSIVIACNVVQLLQIEWNDLVVQSNQFLLLDLIVRLVRDNGNL